MNPVEYAFTIHDVNAGVRIAMTGESIEFYKTNSEAIVRLRHNALAVRLAEIMKDFIRELPK